MKKIQDSTNLKVGDVIVALGNNMAGNVGKLVKGNHYKITSEGVYNNIVSESNVEHICVKVADGVRFRYLYKNEVKRC